MSSPFDSSTLPQISAALDAAPTHAGYADNVRFDSGDHWYGGAYWAGPLPRTSTGQPDAEATAEIKRGFVSKNVIAEVTDRVIGALLGHEPSWRMTPRRALTDDTPPTADEEALIAEAEAALTSFWDQRGMLGLLKDALRTGLLAGRSVFRLYVPDGVRDTTGGLPTRPLPEAMQYLYADPVPSPVACAVVTDARTKQRAGVFRYTMHNTTWTEITYRDPDTGDTIRRVLGGETVMVSRLAVGGAVPIFDCAVPLLITPQLRQLQQDINLNLTMKSRNSVLGGFLERVLLNAQPPGEWIEATADTPGAVDTGGGVFRVFRPSPYYAGAGTVNHVSGIPIYDAQGVLTGYTNPAVQYRDPISPETFITARQDSYRCMLEEVQQVHALMSGDATASGVSRQQAMADFENSILPAKTAMEQLTRWLLETVLAYASTFAGQPGRFAALRADVQLRVFIGPVDSEQRDQNRQDVAAGLMARETAMARNGIEDVDAERAKLDADAERDTALQAQRTDATMQRAGLLRQNPVAAQIAAAVQGDAA